MQCHQHQLQSAGRVTSASAGTNAVIGAGSSPQREVIVPDSEESPGRCLQQRQDPRCASPSLNDPATMSANAQGPDGRDARSQQAMALHGSGHQGSPDQGSSGCSLEALPGHSQPGVCPHSGATDQQSRHPTGHSEHRLLVSQQPAQPEQSHHAAMLKHNISAVAPATSAAAAAVSTSGQMQLEPSIWSGLDPHIRSGLEQALSHSPPLKAPPQQTSTCLPGFGTPIAPAPAGPAEDLGDDVLARKAVQLPLRRGLAWQGVEEGSFGVLQRASRGAEQPVSRAQQTEASQPSSSSLKRVPETPDSAENRSQPTQSPRGDSPHLARFKITL